ncbi:LuxR C-terminal-related transcriptional regulator [Streptomyces sp. 840.1]|uniref:helix-turn-helix transcriptional regulator n=1 Tax=Streptomyces sp. 840.1 TaxID=2485152 RepID=UPI000F4891C6
MRRVTGMLWMNRMRDAAAPALTTASVALGYAERHAQPSRGPSANRPVPHSQGLSHVQLGMGQSSVTGRLGAAYNGAQYRQSSREVGVVELIASGMSNQQIAATRFTGETAVKNQINRIFPKPHSAGRSESITRRLGTAPAPGPAPQRGR